MAKQKRQRVSYEDAVKMLEKKVNKTRNSTIYDYDAHGGSEAFLNEQMILEFLKKITR